jgi:leucyl aminopeptidase
MKIALSTHAPASVAVDVLVVGLPAPAPAEDAAAKALDRALGGALSRQVRDEAFKGKKGETLEIQGQGRVKASRILCVGLGEEKPTPAVWRLLGVKAGRAAAERRTLAVAARSASPPAATSTSAT